MFFHLLRRKWFANVSPRATGEGLNYVRLAAFGGDHYYRNIFRTLNTGKLLYELNTVHDWHVDIAENQIDLTFFERAQRLGAIARLEHFAEVDTCLSNERSTIFRMTDESSMMRARIDI